jgi:hypothetical protein
VDGGLVGHGLGDRLQRAVGLQLAPMVGYGGLLGPFLLLGLGTGAAGVSCTVTGLSGVSRRRHGVGALGSTRPVGSASSMVALLSSSAAAEALARGTEPVAAVLAGQQFALPVVAGARWAARCSPRSCCPGACRCPPTRMWPFPRPCRGAGRRATQRAIL